MTSTHTSFAAACAPARSPSAALLQIPSTFAFALPDRVGAALITDLHSATASATAAELDGVLGVLAVPVVPVLLEVELVAAGELLWLLVEELLLLLPHPAMNTLPITATTNHLDLCLNIPAPSIDESPAWQLLGLRPARVRQRYTRARINLDLGPHCRSISGHSIPTDDLQAPEGVRTKRQLERWVARGVTYARSLPPKR